MCSFFLFTLFSSSLCSPVSLFSTRYSYAAAAILPSLISPCLALVLNGHVQPTLDEAPGQISKRSPCADAAAPRLPPAPFPRRPSHKSLKTKVKLAKAAHINRPLPHWVRYVRISAAKAQATSWSPLSFLSFLFPLCGPVLPPHLLSPAHSPLRLSRFHNAEDRQQDSVSPDPTALSRRLWRPELPPPTLANPARRVSPCSSPLSPRPSAATTRSAAAGDRPSSSCKEPSPRL